MTEEKNGNIKVDLNNAQSGEISTIRNILMGSQLGAYEAKFLEIEKRLEQMEKTLDEINTNVKAKSESTTKHIDQLCLNMKSDFSAKLENMEASFDSSRTNERQELSKLFLELSNRLSK